ncbi:MAG: PAS domain S-box protein [bacterium]
MRNDLRIKRITSLLKNYFNESEIDKFIKSSKILKKNQNKLSDKDISNLFKEIMGYLEAKISRDQAQQDLFSTKIFLKAERQKIQDNIYSQSDENHIDSLQKEFERVVKELKFTKNLYLDFFEKLDTGLFRCTLNKDAKFLEVNQALVDMLGYKSKQELMKYSWDDICFSQPEKSKFLKKIKHDKTVKNYLLKLKRKDQSVLQGSFSAILEKGGKKNNIVIGSVEDLTTQQKLQQKLKYEQELIKIMTNIISEGVITTDQEFKVTFINCSALNMTGYSEAQAIGKEIWDIFILVDPQTNQEFIPDYQQVLNSGDTFHSDHDMILVDKNNQHHFIRYSLSKLEGNNKSEKAVILTFLNITENKKSEKQLSSMKNYLKDVIDSMPSILIGIDYQGLIIQWNQEAERITGYQAEQAKGKYYYEVIPYLENHINTIRKAIISKTIQKIDKIKYYHAGEHRYVEVIIYPLISDKLKGAVIRIDDITTRVRIEEMMVKTEKMISVSGLASGMAHEINNPLSVILHGAENIQRRISPQLKINQQTAEKLNSDINGIYSYLQQRDIPQFLNGILQAGNRVSKVTSNMLKYSISSDIEFHQEDIKKIINSTLQLASHDYELKNIYDFKHINTVKIFPLQFPPVWCIATELEQVLLNLIKNAVEAIIAKKSADFTPPKIIIRLEHIDQKAYISIEDNGIGMNNQIKSKIFEPYFSTKTTGTGNGLGLSVAYYIIKNYHHGDIQVQTAPGKGSTFTVIIPVERFEHEK